MAKLLLAWELGAGLGHAGRLKPLAAELMRRGHETALALHDLVHTRRLLADLRCPKLQAPVWLHKTVGGPARPSSLAELLLTYAYLDPNALEGLVLGWRDLIDVSGADAIVTDYAPTAIVAARIAGVPAIAHGHHEKLDGSGYPMGLAGEQICVQTRILTICDIRAVGPGVWNGWKGQLLRTLYYETELLLAGGFSEVSRKERAQAAAEALYAALSDWPQKDRRTYTKLHYQPYLLSVPLEDQVRHAHFIRQADKAGQALATSVRTDSFHAITEITVLSPDHPRLLAVIAGACAAAGANIVDAQIFTTSHGRALDTIHVSREFPNDEDELRPRERGHLASERRPACRAGSRRTLRTAATGTSTASTYPPNGISASIATRIAASTNRNAVPPGVPPRRNVPRAMIHAESAPISAPANAPGSPIQPRTSNPASTPTASAPSADARNP